MIIDLRKAQKGDKLISVHGGIFTYGKCVPELPYPHLVIYPSGSHGTRLDDGRTFLNRPMPGDHDIVLNLTQLVREGFGQ